MTNPSHTSVGAEHDGAVVAALGLEANGVADVLAQAFVPLKRHALRNSDGRHAAGLGAWGRRVGWGERCYRQLRRG